MNELIKTSMEKALDMVTSLGADQADVIVSSGESFSVSAQNGETDKYKVSGSRVLGIRAMKDEKVGLSYTEFFDDEALQLAAKKSLENAEVSEPRPFEKLRMSDSEGVISSSHTPDQASTQEKIDFAKMLEADVKARDQRITGVPYNGLSESSSEGYYMSSQNCFHYEKEYFLSCYTSALASEAGQNSMHYQGVLARRLADLDVKYCVQESVEHALAWLHAESLPTRSYDVIFHPDTFSEFFGCFSGIFSGKGVMDNVNPFKDKCGSQVIGAGLSIWDRPRYEQAFFQAHYDSEGFKQEDLCLVDQGILKEFYQNTATAEYLKTTANGRAARGAKSALGVSGTTTVFSVGDKGQSEILSGEYFEVLSMQGLHSGSDAYSGEFSFAASGYLCRDGERQKAIKGVTVSGNFYQMLAELKLAGDQLIATTSKDFFAPCLRFEAVSVGGE